MSPQVTPWQVLKQREFGLFWASLLFSAVGSQISTVAIDTEEVVRKAAESFHAAHKRAGGPY